MRLISCWMLSCLLWAALPPLSEEARSEGAKHVFEGVVHNMRANLTTRGNFLDIQDWNYTADIFTDRVLKGDLREKTSVEVVFWHPARRPRGWAGPQGQNEIPYLGNKGIFYVYEEGTTVIGPGPLRLLEPNGWELLEEEDDSWKVTEEL